MGLIAVVVLAVIAGGAFWAGTEVRENRVIQNPSRFLQQWGMTRGGEFGTPGAGFPGSVGTPQPGGLSQTIGGGIMGTIEKIEGNALVISTEEGTIRVQTTIPP